MVLNEEQTLLKDTAREFCKENAPVSALRKLRDDRDETGFSRDLWQQMVELGWAGIVIPEEYDGLDFGYVGLGAILEETGRTLVASPLIATVLLGGSAVTLGGTEEQKKEILPSIATGELLMTLAVDEKVHHAPTNISCSAERVDSGFKINGSKVFVMDGHIADQLIVVTRTSGQDADSSGITLLLVDSNTAGVSIKRTWMVDSRNAADIDFKDVQVPESAVLGRVDRGFELLDKVLDIGRIGLAAEMLGSVQEVFDITLNYLKEREQFGVPIGSFQALKHRAATMFCEIELSRSVVLEALSKLDEGSDTVPTNASLAKAKLCDTFFLVSNEGVQMHGGIGMTDEYDIGFYLKRARVVQQAFGDAEFHRDRYATLNGF